MLLWVFLLPLLRTHYGVPTRGTESAGPSQVPNLPADTEEYSQETKYYRQVIWAHIHRIWELNPETRLQDPIASYLP